MPRRCFLGANGLGFLFQRKPWAKVGQLGLEEWWRKAEFLRVWRASELWITPALKILKIIFAQLPFRQQWVFEINVVWDPMWIMITIQGTNIYKRCKKLCTLASKHQIKIKSLLLSHHHSTSALVSEILMSVLQTVQKKQQTIYIWTDSAKKNGTGAFTVLQTVQKNNNNLHVDRQCKKTTNNLHMDRQCKKNCTGAFTVLQTVQKKTTTIYIWTVHIYRLYRRQCAKYIYSVHIVYYKDTLNYQRHIIHRMGTSILCTVSIHNVVYT